jgi:hypothetical protein
MKIAQFRGVSGVSRIIRFLTRGPYSHSAFVFDGQTEDVAMCMARQLNRMPFLNEGALVEAWLPCVRNVHSISSQHTPGTVVDLFDFNPLLTEAEEEKLLLILNGQIGTPYAVRDVLRFVTRRPGGETGRLFCSELVFMDSFDIGRLLLAETQPWEVPPSWIQRSRSLKPAGTVTTQ